MAQLCTELSEFNPGAVRVIGRLWKRHGDPAIYTLQALGWRGARIWKEFLDVDEDLDRLWQVMSPQLRVVSAENDCPHEDFETVCRVGKVADAVWLGEGESAWALTVRVRCCACKEEFAFDGLPRGMNPTEPMAGIDGMEARLPIRPVVVSADGDVVRIAVPSTARMTVDPESRAYANKMIADAGADPSKYPDLVTEIAECIFGFQRKMGELGERVKAL